MPNIRTTSHVCPQYAALASNPKRNPTAAAILSAISDIIQARVQQRGDGTPAKITPTHYFATLMTALDEGNPSDRQDCMFLLKLLLPHVSQAVLRSKFVDTMDVFSNVLNGGGAGRRQHHEPFGPALDRVHRHGAGRTAMRADILGPAKDPAKLQCYSEPDRGRKTQDS